MSPSAPSPPPDPQGDPAHIDAWFRREHPDVYRLCFGFLADAAEAEDLAQDAMLHLLDHHDSWDSGRPWRSWRDTVVLNLCRDRLRRRAARSRAEDTAASRVAGGVDAEVEGISTRGRLPDPVDAAHRGEVRELLRTALARLSPREREAFVLRDLEGLATADVAERLGIEAGTVRSLLTLARRRLRRLLGPALGHPTGEAPRG